MEITKTKFKKSALGLIPEDWNSSNIESLVSMGGLIRGPFGGALKKESFVLSGYKVYEQKNAIYQSVELGEYYVDAIKFKELKRFEIFFNDFILSCSGTIGRIYKIPEKFQKGIINQALLIIRLDGTKILHDYFYYQFINSTFQKKVIDDTQGGAMKNLIGMADFRKVEMPLPPTLTEQKAIATALNDVDELIANLEKLIEKKKAIKHGAMQQLLTPPHKGGKRLDGFSGEWVETTLGEISKLYQPETISQQQLKRSGYFVYGANGIIGFYDKYNHEEWQVTITCRGSTCGTVNKTVSKSWITGNAMVVNVDGNKFLDKGFLFHLLMNSNFQDCITGSGQPQIVRAPLSKYRLNIPNTVNEQIAIYEILDDMNLAIEELESEKLKFQSIKQGMMQELLTGRTRLL
jgi:type I restriction enzyme S subunit